MPTYNEDKIISNIVDEWSKTAIKCNGILAVINDGSTDNTLDILKEKFGKHSEFIILNKKNSGHGSTCLEGYRWAISNNFKWIFQTDSDGQTKSKEFLEIWQKKESHDFIFGYRASRGDGITRWVISRVLRVVILFVFGVFVKDSNVPFRLMKRKSLKPILERIKTDLFLANALLAVLIQKNYIIKWTPISFQSRLGGTPSVTLRRFIPVGLNVTKEFWQIRSIMNNDI